MSQNNPIRIFAMHCWQDSDDYLRLFEYLESARNFYYRNTSTPDRPPATPGTEAARDDLRRQIDAAELVVAFPSLHEQQPDLAIFQMNYAQSARKPVLLLEHFGAKRELPRLLLDRANDVSGWEERGIVDAIRRLARQENTSRYDTVEFDPEEFKDFRID